MKKLEIRLESGKIIKVDSIQSYIDSEGREYAVAVKGKKLYKVIRRDAQGPIWSESK